ncbi:hypothetical protein EPO05_06980 [Patescibacteria group bacterium]|nr:MAG: hypothetical protein EPO05_06980 [Patescibacteria group bacterium]
MTAQAPNLRELINLSNPENIADALQQMLFGDVLSMLIAALTPTEAAAAVASNQKTLTNRAGILLDVVATAGTTTGRKAILIGGSSVVPTAGQCVWNGTSLVRFAAADAVTASNFLYTNGATPLEIGIMGRRLGQRD